MHAAPDLDRHRLRGFDSQMTEVDDTAARIDALNVLIDQERALIDYYETRQAGADATAAAAITGVLALAALTATAAKAVKHVDRTVAVGVVGALVVVCVIALGVRTVAGLRRSDTELLTVGSPEFNAALAKLRASGTDASDAVRARQIALEVSRARAVDAHRGARSKMRWAAAASGALGLAVAASAFFALTLT